MGVEEGSGRAVERKTSHKEVNALRQRINRWTLSCIRDKGMGGGDACRGYGQSLPHVEVKKRDRK